MPRSSSLLSPDFASGMAFYTDYYADHEPDARLVLPILVAGFPIQAVVDTGAPWCIFDPAILEALDLLPTDTIGSSRLFVRGVEYRGRIVRILVRLQSDQGDSLDVEASVFAPLLDEDDVWQPPNFIGLEGLLNCVRFAVNPAHNTFYFGEI